MTDPENGVVHARLSAAKGRRFLALCVLYGLAALLVWLAIEGRATISGVVLLLGLAVVAAWVGEKMRQSTHGVILLTDDGLFDSDGTQIAAMDEILEITRGAFALKPSNGFTLVLKSQHPRAWRPGVWWRLSRRVGVGGIVSAGAARFMAEQIALRITPR